MAFGQTTVLVATAAPPPPASQYAYISIKCAFWLRSATANKACHVHKMYYYTHFAIIKFNVWNPFALNMKSMCNFGVYYEYMHGYLWNVPSLPFTYIVLYLPRNTHRQYHMCVLNMSLTKSDSPSHDTSYTVADNREEEKESNSGKNINLSQALLQQKWNITAYTIK